MSQRNANQNRTSLPGASAPCAPGFPVKNDGRSALDVEISNFDQGLVIRMGVSGTYDATTAADFGARLLELIRVRQPLRLEVDVSQLVVADADQAVGLFGRAQRDLADVGGDLTVIGSSMLGAALDRSSATA